MNISLNGTNKYRRIADKIVYIRPVYFEFEAKQE